MKKYIRNTNILLKEIELGWERTLDELKSIEAEAITSLNTEHKISRIVISITHGWYENEEELVMYIYGEETDEQFNERIEKGRKRSETAKLAYKNRINK